MIAHFCRNLAGKLQGDHGAPRLIRIAGRKILAEMRAAAFLTVVGRRRDQQGGRRDVLRRRADGSAVHLCNDRERARQTRLSADHADVV